MAAQRESYVQKLQSALLHLPRHPKLIVWLADYCSTNQIAQPQFQDYSDPRGAHPFVSFAPLCLITRARHQDGVVQWRHRTRPRVPCSLVARLSLPRTVARRSGRNCIEDAHRSRSQRLSAIQLWSRLYTEPIAATDGTDRAPLTTDVAFLARNPVISDMYGGWVHTVRVGQDGYITRNFTSSPSLPTLQSSFSSTRSLFPLWLRPTYRWLGPASSPLYNRSMSYTVSCLVFVGLGLARSSARDIPRVWISARLVCSRSLENEATSCQYLYPTIYP
jgi:hypothetical protein